MVIAVGPVEGEGRKKNGRQRNQNFSVQKISDEMIVSSRGPNPYPARRQCTLTFQSNSIIKNAAAQFANSVFWPTYMYDIDPLVASTAVPFFTESAAIWRYYRLLGFSCSASFVNLDSTAAGTVYVCPLNINPGPNSLAWQSLLSNPRCFSKAIGLSTGNGVTQNVRCRAGVDEFGGVKWSGQLDAYCGTTSGSSAPINNIYVAVGYACTPAMGNGLVADVVLRLRVEFFEFTTPPT